MTRRRRRSDQAALRLPALQGHDQGTRAEVGPQAASRRSGLSPYL
jgi:hypothetical protein